MALMKLLKTVAKQVLEKLEDQVEVFSMKAIATAIEQCEAASPTKEGDPVLLPARRHEA